MGNTFISNEELDEFWRLSADHDLKRRVLLNASMALAARELKSEALKKGETLHEEFARVMALGRIALRAEMIDRVQHVTGRVVAGADTGKSVLVPLTLLRRLAEAQK